MVVNMISDPVIEREESMLRRAQRSVIHVGPVLAEMFRMSTGFIRGSGLAPST